MVSGEQYKRESEEPHGESIKDRVQHGYSEVKHTAKKTAREQAEQGQRKAVNRLDDLADSMHDAGRTLEEDDERTLGRSMDSIADRIGSVSDYLRSRDPADLLDDAAGYARRHPEVVLIAAAAGGLLIGRFLKSSAERRRVEAEVRTTDFSSFADERTDRPGSMPGAGSPSTAHARRGSSPDGRTASRPGAGAASKPKPSAGRSGAYSSEPLLASARETSPQGGSLSGGTQHRPAESPPSASTGSQFDRPGDFKPSASTQGASGASATPASRQPNNPESKKSSPGEKHT